MKELRGSAKIPEEIYKLVSQGKADSSHPSEGSAAAF